MLVVYLIIGVLLDLNFNSSSNVDCEIIFQFTLQLDDVLYSYLNPTYCQ